MKSLFFGRIPRFKAIIQLADGSPEEWQCQTRAVERDQEIGHPSPLVSAIICN